MRETSAKMSLRILHTCVSCDMSLGWMDGHMKVREGRKAVEVFILWLGGGRKKQNKSGIGVQSDVSMDKGHCLKCVKQYSYIHFRIRFILIFLKIMILSIFLKRVGYTDIYIYQLVSRVCMCLYYMSIGI